jgi:hypothetical protein
VNPHLEKYKNIHEGEHAILYGSGPTLLQSIGFDGPLKCGSNEQIYADLNLDYYFIGDAGTTKRGYLSDPESYLNFKPNIMRFCRTRPVDSRAKGYTPMPQDMSDWIYYKITDELWDRTPAISSDITKDIYDSGSISYEALQFILYTGVKTIFLIGHDCSYAQGSFKTKMNGFKWGNTILKNWESIAESVKEHYPEVNIYIINPVAMNFFPEITLDEAKEMIQ